MLQTGQPWLPLFWCWVAPPSHCHYLQSLPSTWLVALVLWFTNLIQKTMQLHLKTHLEIICLSPTYILAESNCVLACAKPISVSYYYLPFLLDFIFSKISLTHNHRTTLQFLIFVMNYKYCCLGFVTFGLIFIWRNKSVCSRL